MILVCDDSSLEDAQRIHAEIRKAAPGAVFFLVGTMCDSQRPVSSADIEAVAKGLGVCWFDTSARTGEGVDVLFEAAAVAGLHAGRRHSDPSRGRLDGAGVTMWRAGPRRQREVLWECT
jgi:hypothetical protein